MAFGDVVLDRLPQGVRMNVVAMNQCVFCEIIQGRAPAHRLWENENILAILTTGPINSGHSLLIPKAHIEYFFDLGEPAYLEAFQAAKRLAEPLRKATGARKIGLVLEGFTVPHAHLHLIPLHERDQIDPRRVRQMNLEQLAEIAEMIKGEINSDKREA